MRNRVNTWKSFVGFAVCAAGLSCAPLDAGAATPAAAPPPGSIGQASDELAAQALDLLNNGKLSDAAAAYNSLLQKYPNSGAVPEALFRLGYIQYVQGSYDQAVATLRRIVSPPATPDIKAAGDALIPQVLAAQAGKMAPGDPRRKPAFQNAIQQFDAFIQKNPANPAVETANYGKAVAAFQCQDYDAAVRSLRDNLKRYPNSESILDSEDLLAVALTAEATDLLDKNGDRQAAMDKFDEALHHLANIIVRHSDVVLANDAQFQIGEVLFNRGNAEEGAKRDKDVANAIEAYRAVLPKEMMVQAQQDRVAALLPRLRQAVLTRDQAGVVALQQLQDRENAKLDALKGAPDETMNAQLRIAASYFLLQRYDEARVLLKFLEGFAGDDAQKKQIAYYLVLTYAQQGITGKAEQAYNEFQSKYKGDPLGANLPLAMGTAFLNPKNNNPDKAIAYFNQEITLYPKSPLVNTVLGQEAGALIGLQRFDEALSTYRKFLAGNPPRDQAAQAELGIANIYQATQKIPDAIKQYQKVVSTYPGSPQAEQGAFYAAGLETGVDPKKAVADLQAFVKKYPDGDNTPRATMMIAQMQAAMGDIPGAMQTYKDIAAKFPKSEFAPQSYFQRAAILSKQGKTDEMAALLREYIKAYPDSKDVFYAYDTIGQTQASNKQAPKAIATYSEMVDRHGENPMAATAQYRIAELWQKQADSMGRYLALNEAQRKEWSKDIAGSVAAAEKLIEKYPDSDQAGLDLKALLADQEMLLSAKQTTPDDIDKYFHGLADKFGNNPSAKSRILFTLATFTFKTDPARALTQMAEAYKPSLVYAPADLDLYGAALIEQGKPDEAYKIYQKIANDYPIPAGTQPNQAQTAVQEAQATALFGMGSAIEKQGRTADAGKLFTQLKTFYPWSPKVVEANFGIAKSLVQQNKLAEALDLLAGSAKTAGIVQSRNAPAKVRAQAFLLIGDIYSTQGNIDSAIDAYLKTAAFYGGVTEVAPEALLKGGQMLEKQAAMLNEQSTPKKSDQIQKAVNAYKTIVSKYSGSPFVKQAQDRLNALPAAKQ